jgi:hypothetical protein
MVDRALTTLAICALAALAGCSKGTGPDEQSDGGPPPDTCNSAQLAASDPTCALALTPDTEPDAPPGSIKGSIQGYISTQGDQDWYVIDLASLPARPLLSVTVAYGKSSPVVLSVNVLKADGTKSLGSAVDQHVVGAPGARLVVRLTEAGKYYLKVANDLGAEEAAVEKRFPYTLTATVLSDPDVHEPNDSTPTPVNVDCGTPQVIQNGALATPGDIDRYVFDVPSCSGSGRTLVHVEAAQTTAPQAHVVRLVFQLTYDPSGPSEKLLPGGDIGLSPGQVQKVATAGVAARGHYELVVQNWKDTTKPGSDPPGDPLFTYKVTIKVWADQDDNEDTKGNDSLSLDSATPVSLTVNGPAATKEGRLSYVGDLDVFAVTCPTSSPCRLHYKITSYGTSGAQFEALPTLNPRELAVLEDMNSPSECNTNCPGGKGDGYGADWCSRQRMCLWQQRTEDPKDHANFDNFEGQLYIQGGGTRYVQVGYRSGQGADDRPYTLELKLLAGQAPHVLRKNPFGADTVTTTILGWGFGERTRDPAPNSLRLLPTYWPDEPRDAARIDYDAASQVDFFQIPVSSGDHSLDISWIISGSNSRSYDIGIRFHFCEDPACSSMVESPGFFGYAGGQDYPWFSTLDNPQPQRDVFLKTTPAGTFTVNPAMCYCIDNAYTAAGKFFIEVQAQDRTRYDDATTTINLTAGAYPPSGCPPTCAWAAKTFH